MVCLLKRYPYHLIFMSLLLLLTFGCGGGDSTSDSTSPADGDAGEQIEAVITSQEIPRGTVITEDILTSRPFPTNVLPPEVITDKANVIGKSAKIPIPQGAPLTTEMVE